MTIAVKLRYGFERSAPDSAVSRSAGDVPNRLSGHLSLAVQAPATRRPTDLHTDPASYVPFVCLMAGSPDLDHSGHRRRRRRWANGAGRQGRSRAHKGARPPAIALVELGCRPHSDATVGCWVIWRALHQLVPQPGGRLAIRKRICDAAPVEAQSNHTNRFGRGPTGCWPGIERLDQALMPPCAGSTQFRPARRQFADRAIEIDVGDLPHAAVISSGIDVDRLAGRRRSGW